MVGVGTLDGFSLFFFFCLMLESFKYGIWFQRVSMDGEQSFTVELARSYLF